MNKTVFFRIFLAVAIYGVFAALVVTFYDDSPSNMDWEDRELFNRQYITRLTLDNVTLNKIIEELGSPDITEAKKVEQENYQVMFYRTQHIKSDGITTQEECTPLLFKNNQLVAIGIGAYERYQSL